MSYLPGFLKLENKKVLIIGGGNIANRKLKYLLQFTKNITIISQEFNTNIQSTIDEYKLIYYNKKYEVEDIKDFNFVIVAANNIILQKDIFYEAKKYNRCFVNSVDSIEYCDFILPAIVKQDNLTITVSTNGTSPAFAKQFLQQIKKLIPNNISKFLIEMKDDRDSIPKGKKRIDFFNQKVKNYLLEN